MVVSPVHGVLGTPVPPKRYRVVTCCDHFPPRRKNCFFQKPIRLYTTKPINEPGFLEIFLELIFAESCCVPRKAPSFATTSCVYWMTPFLYTKFDALVVTSRTHKSPILEARRHSQVVSGNHLADQDFPPI